MIVPPDVVMPGVSLAARLPPFPNALSRPMRLPTLGVLGVCSPASGADVEGAGGLPPQPEKSSGVGAVETDGRLVRKEK